MIVEFPGDGVKCISKLQSHCANMTFAGKSKYDKLFCQVTHKGYQSAMNYINIFQNAQALLISVGNSSSEDQLMRTFLDEFHQGGKHTSHL